MSTFPGIFRYFNDTRILDVGMKNAREGSLLDDDDAKAFLFNKKQRASRTDRSNVLMIGRYTSRAVSLDTHGNGGDIIMQAEVSRDD